MLISSILWKKRVEKADLWHGHKRETKEDMTCCSTDCVNDQTVSNNGSPKSNKIMSCPSCGLAIKYEEKVLTNQIFSL